jgi:hypothetical protein
MKIAIVCYPTFGGSGVVATELGLELAWSRNPFYYIQSTGSLSTFESKYITMR